jgi:hypothetical protein
MASWIFKCNPKQYRLSFRLADPNPAIAWRVTRYHDEIGSGDTVFIWETGPNRGIRAIMRLDEGPREMAELETEQPYNSERDLQSMLRVLGTLTHRDVNLSHQALRDVSGLENLSVFRKDIFQKGTNFPVTSEESAILLRLINDDRA